MQFKYKGYDKTGKKVKGTIAANSSEEAGQKLRAQGIYHEGLTAASDFSLDSLTQRQMPEELLATFSKELSSYLRSGMTLLTAFKLLENQYQKEKRYVAFLNSIRTMIEEGKSLFHALTQQTTYTLPEFYTQSLKIAGQGGKMIDVLVTMADFFSSQNKVKKQVQGAMIYPMVIFSVAIAIIGFLLVSVVPTITEIFADTGQELPEITQVVLTISDFLIDHYMLLLIVFILLVVGFKLAYSKGNAFRQFVDGVFMKIPFFGNVIQNHELGRFSYILALMLSSGVAYANAVQMAKTTFGNYGLKDLFEKASTKVMEGNKLSNSLQLTKGVKLKRNFMQSLALGEETSEVESILTNVANLYVEENDEKLKIMLSLINPFMMIFIGTFVGVIIAAMMLPIFTMSQGLG
jgi:general secretion pathway protein F/type IV pilus assembly protein PilC